MKANKTSMEKAIKASQMGKSDKGYAQGQLDQSSFIDTVASGTLEEADRFSAEGQLNAEWEKYNTAMNNANARNRRVSTKVARRFAALSRLKSAIVKKRLNNTLSGLDIKEGEDGYENAKKMRQDYLQRVAQGGNDVEIDEGGNFLKNFNSQERRYKEYKESKEKAEKAEKENALAVNANNKNPNGKKHRPRRVSVPTWTEEDRTTYNKYQNLKMNLDALRNGTEGPKYVPGQDPQQVETAPPKVETAPPQEEENLEKNEKLEELLKMSGAEQKNYISRYGNGNDTEFEKALDALNKEFSRRSQAAVDKDGKKHHMSEKGRERFKKLSDLKDDIKKHRDKNRMYMRRTEREDEFEKQKNAMLAKMDELELDG